MIRALLATVLIATIAAAAARAEGLREREQMKLEAEVIAEIDGVKDPDLRRVVVHLIDTPDTAKFSAHQAKAGDIGQLIAYETVSESQPSGTNKYARVSKSYPQVEVRISQVLDEKNVIVDDFRGWVEGIDTSGLTDDSLHDFRRYLLECRGTKRYETDLGSRTVKHFVAVDADAINPVLKRIAKLRSNRIWLDKSEKHATRAQFVDFEKGTVLLQSPEGKEIVVKLTQLSKDDQKWVRDIIKGMK